ncbi:Predicted ATP-binding protein involved in virulence [Haploplasma axanthum]|uniref:Predicted ATP-binding protein involved in virulence n=2 Tax=Haploplasma axanthum TaxID=29552 RepID=A0A449BC00_HAPAX|nr:Predicted ATP-binding protein involved in virulence [Haploplasma axanthum]
MLINIIEKTENSIYSLSKQLKVELEKYNDFINKFNSKIHGKDFFNFDMKYTSDNIENSTNYYHFFENLHNKNDQMIKELEINIKDIRQNDELTFKDYFFSNNTFNHDKEYKLIYKKPRITSFEEKYIKIDEKGIIDEIEKINIKTTKYRDKIKELFDKFDQEISILRSIIYIDEESKGENDNNYFSILREIFSICNPKIYYLSNDNNELFFKKDYRRYNSTIDEKRIIETFIRYRYSDREMSEINQKINKGNFLIDKEELSVNLEKYINENLPEYEKNIKIKVDKNLVFSIIEETGEIIPFSETNTGRKWFITYFFIKSCLREGDILIMDEPANYLHPEAQIQVLSEVEKLSKKNKIIMTTHSPYMISPIALVYYVEMSTNGTRIIEKENNQFNLIHDGLGVPKTKLFIADLLLNNNLDTLDEIAKKLNIYFKEKGIKQSEIANDYGSDIRTINRKLNKRSNLSYDDIRWFCEKYDIDIISLLSKPL